MGEMHWWRGLVNLRTMKSAQECQTTVNLEYDVKHRTEEKSLNSGGIKWGDISGKTN